MSEVQSRGVSSRGRGGYRGGRGGYRGSRGGKSHTSRDDVYQESAPLEEQGEIGGLKAKYSSKLSTMREVVPGWSDEDLVFALQETDGDEVEAIERITTGLFAALSVYLGLTMIRFDITMGRSEKEGSKTKRCRS